MSDFLEAEGSAMLSREFTAAAAAYNATGLCPDFPEDPAWDPIMRSDILRIPFCASEARPDHHRTAMSPEAYEYITGTYIPTLHRAAEEGEPQVLALAQAVGRLFGALLGAGVLSLNEPLAIQGAIASDKNGNHMALARQPAVIHDWGMGINGLKTHVLHARNAQYRLVALQKDLGEAAFLRGMVDFFGIGGSIEIRSGGVAALTKHMVQTGEQADLIIASRLHVAGEELRQALPRTSTLLRPQGTIIAAGPRAVVNPASIGYDEVHALISQDSGLAVVEAEEVFYVQPGAVPEGGYVLAEQNMLIHAQRH